MGVQSLYTGYLVEKSRDKKRSGAPENVDDKKKKTGNNPVCGDQITWYVKLEGRRIVDIRYEVKGCLISKASASFLAEIAARKTIDEVKKFMERLAEVIKANATEPSEVELKKQNWLALAQIRDYPTRKKCVLLAWETLLDLFGGIS